MKIVIVGAGAIGSLLAAYLLKSKEEILILEKTKERALKINQNGINIESSSGNWKTKPKATAELKDIENADLVILTVKSYDTKETISRIKSVITDKTFVLTLQNGIGNVENIAEFINPDKIIAGTTNIGATFLELGKIRHAGKGETIIGTIDNKLPVEIRHIREVFNKAGLETKISREIKGILWSKLIISTGINALTAITRLENGKLIKLEGTKKILREAVTEALRVAKRKRIKLIYDDPLAKVESVCEATATNTSSMLQDVLRKKHTEVDYINGAIVRLAQELGMNAPVNSMLLDLIKTIENSYDSSLETIK
jgi:2-dehydropantoate 2-reductase